MQENISKFDAGKEQDMSDRDAVIIRAVRTPIAKFKGDFADISVPDLAAIPLRAILEKTGLKAELIDELILGNLFASDWGNVARASLLAADYPISVPGVTLDRQCSSALNATAMAASMIQTGMADIIIAGGVESYSQQPFLVERPRVAFPGSINNLAFKLAPSSFDLGSLGGDMIATAENLAKQYNVSREECDAFALDSQLKAAKAWQDGCFDEQVIPVSVPQRKGDPKVVTMDACVRPETSMEGLAKLRTIMKDGITTAGNSSPMNDGASAILIMSRKKAEELGYKPLAVIKEYAAAGVDPGIMGFGPVKATEKLMARHGYKIDDFDLMELNEAFAAQSIPCIRELGIDPARVNVEGGAIAIGHPNGCSGGILVARMVYALKHRDLKRGLISFCCGGGLGFSLIVENEN